MHEVSGAASVAIILALWVSGLSAFGFGVVVEIIRRARLAREGPAPPALSGIAVLVPGLGDAKSVDEAKSIRDTPVAMPEETERATNRYSGAEAVEIRAAEVVLRRRRVANPEPAAHASRIAKG